MTRNEAIQILSTRDAHGVLCGYTSGVTEALDMAIEALQEPKTIIGIDIPYGSDKGIATLFKGKEDKLILEEIKEIMSVVRCKDCRHWDREDEYCTDGEGLCGGVTEDDYCSHGERREE